jgi:thymidylate kinase
MRIIVFEGADRSGKTTSIKLFNKLTGYKYLTIHRAFYSNYVYDKYHRKDQEGSMRWINLLKEINRALISSGWKPVTFVLLEASSVILKRKKYFEDQILFSRDFDWFVQETGSIGVKVQNVGTKEDLIKELMKLTMKIDGGEL